MRVSVALCTYNGSRFVQAQLASIAAQSMLPDELVVCDDGSTDTTAEIIRDFVRTAPFEVRFVQNGERLGTTKNFEKAITLCRGQFIALADQDDVWRPDKLRCIIGTMDSGSEPGGAFSDAELMDEQSNPLGRRLWQSIPFHPPAGMMTSEQFVQLLLRQDAVTGATLVFRSQCRASIMPIPDSWAHDAWIAWMLVLHSSLALVRDPLMSYRVHPEQQLGVTKPLKDRIHSVKQRGLQQRRDMARRFEDLRTRWLQQPGPEFERRLSDLDGKIAHCYFRTGLVGNRVIRACRMLGKLPSYCRYSRPLVSICSDLLM
jgi:glycosyltransferase involved in cell wall biosynthesis